MKLKYTIGPNLLAVKQNILVSMAKVTMDFINTKVDDPDAWLEVYDQIRHIFNENGLEELQFKVTLNQEKKSIMLSADRVIDRMVIAFLTAEIDIKK